MAETRREVWITGLGIVSCLGEGPDAHWQGLNDGKIVIDTTTFAPYIVHPLAATDFDKQIPKKGDQRQMEPWQRIGVYAAGLALDSAGCKGNAELLGRMDLIVAAGGGERDEAADGAILTGLMKTQDPAPYMNERLMSDLSPTLFLAQLSNLLAGNVSIVHGVTGSSRTFMGEETAGVDAVRIALARIQAGQSDITIVGGAHNGERHDELMIYEFGGYNLKNEYRPIWDRGPDGGFALGSLGAFLVLEHAEHAQSREVKPIAKLKIVVSDRADRSPGSIQAMLERLFSKVGSGKDQAAFISGATGAEPATGEEKKFFASHPDLAVRATGSVLGHGFEPQFVMNIALAALAVSRGKLFPPCGGSSFERPMDGKPAQVIVTGVGHWRGEGLAVIEAVS